MVRIKSKNPEAYISIGKNRQKIHNNKFVYLNNQQEFSFEFFNPINKKIGIKIFLNGEPISNSMLILPPGKREWLERFIDNERKFLFETYMVGNSQEVKEAIANNGDVKIEFYRERLPANNPYILNSFNSSVGRTYTTYGSCCPTHTNVGIGGTALGSITTTGCYYSNNFECDSSMQEQPKSLKKGKTETGRVEKGDYSDQKFSYTSVDLEYFPFHTVEYKILPFSEKPIETRDLKIKCKSCGRNLKNDWKVCPYCTTELLKCSSCGEQLQNDWVVCPKCGNKLR